MVQVIGEIGGSSSRWAVLSVDGSHSLWPPKGERWSGFNPLSGDGDAFAEAIRQHLFTAAGDAVTADDVHIYGAGCGNGTRKERMSSAIRAIWPDARITVDTDLMGTAIGVCAGRSGLVLILGTGMNAGYYEGVHLHRPMPSLGYLLGDEGSGADLGKCLLQDAFYGRIPEALHVALFGPEGPVLNEELERIHGAPHPARALATYTARLADHLDQPYVRDLVGGRFHAMAELLTRYFTLEQRREVYATGSVAFGFRELLAECLLDRGMSLNAVERDPLPGLVLHHQQQG